MEISAASHASDELLTAIAEDDFLAKVFPAELEEICRRRETVGIPVDDLAGRVPTGGLGLQGLALSGGGIRSAAFNLGVLQALSTVGRLKHIDYLSTVSGGGYIGASVSALLMNDYCSTEPNTFPLHFDSLHEKRQRWRGMAYSEPDAIRHLRDGARYLAPGGLFDLLVLPVRFLMNTLTNLIALSVYVSFFALGAVVLVPNILPNPEDGLTEFYRSSLRIAFAPLAVLIALGLVIGPLLSRYGLLRSAGRRGLFDRATVGVLLVVLFVAFAILQPAAIRAFVQLADTINASPSWGIASISAAVLALTKIAQVVAKIPSGLQRRLLIVLLAIAGPFIAWISILALGAWIWEGSLPAPLQRLASAMGESRNAHAEAEPAFVSMMIWFHDKPEIVLRTSGVFVWMVTVVLVYWKWVNINETSMHVLYRDRLARLFVFRTAPSGLVDYQDSSRGIKLSELCPPRSAAPYQLINTAVNLQGSENSSLRGRSADFFLLSKRFVGSKMTGYCPTQEVERADLHLDLAAGIAISGAAVAPDMGVLTNRAAAFTMMILNARLGYWLPNPGQTAKRESGRPKRVEPYSLIREALWMDPPDERWPHVYLSDGGHIENLGAFELLRRRCSRIIISDAECDPALSLHGLAVLVRLARTDLGADIDIDASSITPEHVGQPSSSHYAFGTIRYADGSAGELLYIKASLTGDENVYVQQFKLEHPDFPHTPTSDQFFTEAQFEAYRSLGYHIGTRVLREVDPAGLIRE